MRHSPIPFDKILGLVAVLGLAVTAANARTIHVDDNAPNDPCPGDPTCSDPDEDGSPEHPFDAIQEGIDDANHFDTVLVADGTYTGDGNKNLDFGGMRITVRSQNGADNCTIDCEGSGRGFYFHYGESDASVVEGFTITNGSGGVGGAVLCVASGPTIANCTMTGNSATYEGGALGCTELSSPTIINCDIIGNTATRGGGVSCAYDSSPRITNCRITHNAVSEQGGGIWCYDHSSPMISWSSIEGNVANEGGGVYCEHWSSPKIVNCSIEGNTAWNDAGGIYSRLDSHPRVTNSAISGNSAARIGGGMLGYQHGRGTLTNCTIAGNMASHDGGGICGQYGANVTIYNCILWANAAPNGPQIALLPFSIYSSVASVSYSDVQGGQAAIPVCSRCTLDWGPGNIDANPFFANPGTGDYRLWAGSPCIDAGDNGAVPPDIADVDGDGDTAERTPLDLGGNLRFVNDCETPDTGTGTPPIVDMGAYEYQPSDVDTDGDLDLLDFAGLQLCLTGPDSGPVDAGCEGFDADCDDDVDLSDFALFQRAITRW